MVNTNTHYQANVERAKDPPQLDTPGPKDERAAIVNTADAFHTYGLWWVDPNTLHFYYDWVRSYVLVRDI